MHLFWMDTEQACRNIRVPSLMLAAVAAGVKVRVRGRHYQAHVRSHFVTNMGVAGGLVLLQSMGAGGFTVDRLLQKKAT